MKIKNIFSILIILLFNISIIYFFNTKIFSIPPLGKFLDPFNGYLYLSNSDNLPKNDIILEQLTDSVTIVWDDLRIPHIFSKNESDLYFTQGYIMARDRLWQMEFQTIVAEGRLSEIIGKNALQIDKFHRRIGIKYGALNSLNAIKNDTIIYNMLNAFSSGINTYIENLNERTKPLEYKILDYYPEKWSPYKTFLILKYMAWTLSGKSSDLAYSKLLNQFNLKTINELFPLIPYNVDPIIPKNTTFNFKDANIPNAPDSFYVSNPFQSSLLYEPIDGFSNNWVVSKDLSIYNKPIIASDPHLSLTLPSVWYGMHLNDTNQNVIGVTIPGAPGIIMGCNDSIAWAETNGYDDVMDWYDIYFKDKSMNEYYYDNDWHTTDKVVEKFHIRNSQTFYDTITYTKHGPVVWDYDYQTLSIGAKSAKGSRPRQAAMGRALRWQAHDGTNEIRTFYEINNAKNYNDFVNALEWFVCPGQNFAYVDENNISMWHAGSPPIKWKEQGRYIGDGRDPKYEWGELIPHNHKAHIKNPKQGFLSSANQHPSDGKYPYYLSETFWPSFRAIKINEVLSTSTKHTLESMQNLQNDNTNMLALTILPHMINAINSSDLNEIEYKLFSKIKNWNYNNNKNLIEPTIFDLWYNKINEKTWEDDLGKRDEYTMWPQIDKLSELIEYDKNSIWFDNKHTSIKENFDNISLNAFSDIVKIIYQNNLENQWQWGNYQETNITHLAKIPGLGETNLYTSGGLWTVNATTKEFGPSWRSIIIMDNPKIIKGIYPGGQSGFPGSKYYDNMIQDWVKGKLYNLEFSSDKNNINRHKINLISKINDN